MSFKNFSISNSAEEAPKPETGPKQTPDQGAKTGQPGETPKGAAPAQKS